MKKKSIGIIGGGLTGLTAAYYLQKEDISTTIIEARGRLGGRIHTKYSDQEAPIELGATWLGKKHTSLLQLLQELEIDIFEQFMGTSAIYEPISTSPPQIVTMPYNPDPTYRIKGGSSQLIECLAETIKKESLHLNTIVKSIAHQKDSIVVDTSLDRFQFDTVILTLPPRLFVDSIHFHPSLPEEFMNVGKNTHTWMSESIKVALTYDRPFWREGNKIGSIFSNTGLIPEMYDHTDYENKKYALKGFINGGFAQASKEERKTRVLAQLTKYFGTQAQKYISYEELIWRDEQFTHSDYDGFILPHQNNGNPILQSSFYDGRLLIGGSETANHHPGYMDGAVESGRTLSQKIKSN